VHDSVGLAADGGHGVDGTEDAVLLGAVADAGVEPHPRWWMSGAKEPLVSARWCRQRRPLLAPAGVGKGADARLAATCAEVGVEGADAATCAEVGVEGADAATCAEVGVQDADAVLEDGDSATPFMRSRISFIRRNFSSILDIEAQRSSISTMAQFDLEEKNWVDSDGTRDFGKNLGDSEEQGSDYQFLWSYTSKSQ